MKRPLKTILVITLISIMFIGGGVNVLADLANGGGANLTVTSPAIDSDPVTGSLIAGNAWVEYDQDLPAPNSVWCYAELTNEVTTDVQIGAPLPVETVTLLDVANDQGGSLVVTWSVVEQPPTINHYNIYISETDMGSSVVGLSPVVSQNYIGAEHRVTFNGYNKFTAYYVAVTAVNIDLVENQSLDTRGGPVVPSDNVAPATVNVTVADVGGDNGDQLKVEWPLSADDGTGADDVIHYEMYVSANSAQLFSAVNKRGTFYLDNGIIRIVGGLETDVTYNVGVLIYDDSGNVDTTNAVVAQAVPIDDLPPNAIGDFTATGGDTQITLNWTNTTDVTQITILRKVNGIPTCSIDGTVITQNMAVTSGDVSTVLDTGLINGTHYYYKLWAYDSYDNESGGVLAHAFAEGVVILGGVEIPNNEYGLTVSQNASYVTNFAERRDEYLGAPPAGFTGTGLGFNIVADGAATENEGEAVGFAIDLEQAVDPSYDLYKIMPDGTWVGPIAYVMDGTTINITLNIAADGSIDPLFVFGEDLTAPDAVSNFDIEIVTKNIKLTWTNPDTGLAQNIDYAGVTVRRSTGNYAAPDGGVEVASGDITSYTDTDATVSDNVQYFYAVYAYDDATTINYSVIAKGYAVTDFSPPEPVSNFSAENILGNDGTGVHLTWDRSTDDTLGSTAIRWYRIYRSTTTSNVYAMDLLRIVRPRADSISIVDNDDIVKDTTYYYALTGIDDRNNESFDTAVTASATVLDTLAPPSVISLLANVTTDDVALTWNNPVDMSDVSYNLVIRKAGSFPTSPTDSGATVLYDSGITENYTDSATYNAELYYYYVYTVDDSGNYSGQKTKFVHREAADFGSGTYSASTSYSAMGTKSRYALTMSITNAQGAEVGAIEFLSTTTWTASLTLADGDNLLTVTSYTIDGTILNEYETLVIVDMIPPAPPLIIVNGKELIERGVVYTNKARVTIQGTAEPGVRISLRAASAQAGPQSLIDISSIDADSLGNYGMVLDVIEGVNYISVKATDMAGNATVVEGVIVLDTILPSIGDITFDGNQVVTGDMIAAAPLIKVKVYDGVSGIDASAVTLSIDGIVMAVAELDITTGTSNSVVEFTYRVPADQTLAAGEHDIVVEVGDRAGNAKRIVMSDLTVPASAAAAIVGDALNYPNPFGGTGEPTTKIAYQLTAKVDIDMYFYNITGERLLHKVIAAGENGARIGYNEVEWDGRNSYGEQAGNGVYIVHIITADNGGQKLLGKVKILVLR
ncbi:hypothetical protein ACFL57_00575 [Candidatus Margulisiibacteriota bacterium]